MRRGNQSRVSEFILLGLPIPPEDQDMCYAMFLAMYLTTVLGNLLIILLIRMDSRLHTPMYFFLCHLAFSDISLCSVTVPKMLMNMLTRSLSISYAECVSQVYFSIIFVDLDSFLLTSMAYDRYVAICHPLHYTTTMSHSLCFLLVVVSWALSFASALVHTLLLTRLSLFKDNTLHHFFCDLSDLLKLSSSDTTINELVILTVGVVVITVPCICILVSYGHIGATILRAPSMKGICKAFSTCGSHLSVVSLYYGAIIGLYFVPSSNNTNDKDVIVSVLFTLVTPMLNPFIYSLRNRDMKGALRNILKRRGFSEGLASMSCMRRNNQSSVSEFILLGLPIQPEDQSMYYALFLAMYLTTVLGNLLIILLIRLDSRLHTPMYFFLSHLAFSDISLSSVIVPKMLMNMLTRSQSISYAECISQVYFFNIFVVLDSFLLTSMAYDRYVAICHPLHYTQIISQNLCFLLVIVSWALSCANALVHTLLFASLSLFKDNVLHHFFCDLSALLKLSSSDTTINTLAILTLGSLIITVPFMCILVSYGLIGSTVLRTPSAKGICKALSTCGSHVSVVSLYYGAIIGLYFVPSSSNISNKDVIVSVLYTLVTPMLNPFIYSLRNRDMKGALRNILKRRVSSET
ncbi:neuropeptide Y receptor type 5-like [Nannospalax galili]|uniref:neuropeptide Y receptor type 5-like n=1 Tax=Nannospalax galili TaxID=1026970 RepID=UPI00111BD4F7|nr:neuropeptide Y receptor type 5-like [Nannospalax galili]